MYSPDQVEFYLIDFKKGVEFKTYATHHLPHARVIAIESEREFGLSVLERLDGELRRRGELFRAAGVQDLARLSRGAAGRSRCRGCCSSSTSFKNCLSRTTSWRRTRGCCWIGWCGKGVRLAFTCCSVRRRLSGAYSLARSTMGQMAVRVALQCSEADAHLILSDERNEAARFLSRPGEAIYNDQNGLLAGNHPFQVVWLPESQAGRLFAAGRGVARRQQHRPLPQTIVFEGDQAADPANNLQLRESLDVESG